MKIFRYAIGIFISAILACGGAARKNNANRSLDEPDSFASYRAYDHFITGDLYEQSGNLDSAAEEYRKALILDPQSIEIKRVLSEVYFQQRKYAEGAILRSEISEKNADDYNFIGDCQRFSKELESAADFYNRSLQIDSTQYLTRVYLARILDYLGRRREAERQYRALIDYAPNKVDSYLDLAEFYLKGNKMDKAMETYAEASAIDSSDVRPVVGMAGIFLGSGDTLRADSLYFTVASRNWENIQVLSSLVASFLSINDLEKAETIAARIAELAPDDAYAKKRYAMILFGNRKFPQAESLMTFMDEKGEADAPVYFYLARLKQEKRDYPSSESYFRKSLALADTIGDAWINLALVVNEQHRYEDALQVMGQAMGKIPRDSSAIVFFTAMIHSRNNHYELARDGYLRLLQSNPDDMGVRFNLAAAYERLGLFEEAEKGFNGIIEKDPRNAMTLNYLGYMYADRGVNLDRARELIERALAQEPDNGAYLDSYAWVLYKMGKYDEALVQMKRAVKTETEDPVVYDHQGDIYLALNQDELARQSWAKALELKPDDETIRSKLYPR